MHCVKKAILLIKLHKVNYTKVVVWFLSTGPVVEITYCEQHSKLDNLCQTFASLRTSCVTTQEKYVPTSEFICKTYVHDN